jgi:hypothetical protein
VRDRVEHPKWAKGAEGALLLTIKEGVGLVAQSSGAR